MASLKEAIAKPSSSDSEIDDFEISSDAGSLDSDDSGKGESVIKPKDDKYERYPFCATSFMASPIKV